MDIDSTLGMTRARRKSALQFLFAATALILAACSKVTAENYDQLATGMTPDEVHAILGRPGAVDAGTLGNFEVRTEIWQSRRLRIEISFLNGKLMRKSVGEPEAPESG